APGERGECSFTLDVAPKRAYPSACSLSNPPAELQQVTFHIGTLLGSNRTEDRVERGRDLIDGSAKLAGSVSLPQFRLFSLCSGERLLEKRRATPITRLKQLVKTFHFPRRHLAVAVGKTQEDLHWELDEHPRFLCDTNRHGNSPMLQQRGARGIFRQRRVSDAPPRLREQRQRSEGPMRVSG